MESHSKANKRTMDLFYKIASLVAFEALIAWFISFLLIFIGKPMSAYAIYVMAISTLMSFIAIFLVGFAQLQYGEKE